MPYTATEPRRASQINRGAKLTEHGEQVVISKDVKSKYTYLTVAPSIDSGDIQVLKFAHDASLVIEIERQTAEEKLAAQLAHADRWVSTRLQGAMTDTPADYLLHKATEWKDSNYGGHVLDSFEASTFFHLQAEYRAWRTIANTYKRLQSIYGEKLVTSLSAFVIEIDDRVTSDRHPSDPLSRSTSTFSNIIDDLDRYAWDKLSDAVRWYVGADAYKHELARLRELKPVESDDED